LFSWQWVHSGPHHRKILGNAIREHRKRMALSQEKLAERAELSPVYVSQLECGKANVSLDALARIARGLKLQVNELTRGF